MGEQDIPDDAVLEPVMCGDSELPDVSSLLPPGFDIPVLDGTFDNAVRGNPIDNPECTSTMDITDPGQLDFDDSSDDFENDCCSTQSRVEQKEELSKEAAEQVKDKVESYTQNTEQVLVESDDIIKTFHPSMNVYFAFGLDQGRPLHSRLESIQTIFEDGIGPGELKSYQARKILEEVIGEMQKLELELIFLQGSLESVDYENLQDLKDKIEDIIGEMDGFNEDVLKPFRFQYHLFAKVPLSRGAMKTLKKELKMKYQESADALNVLKEKGLTFPDSSRYLQSILDSCNNVDIDNRYGRLVRIVYVAEILLIQASRQSVNQGLIEDPTYRAAYDEMSMALFRRGDHISLHCLAVWALRRRLVYPQLFELNVMRRGVSEKYLELSNDAQVMDDQLALMLESQDRDIHKHYINQKVQTKTYQDAAYKVLVEICKQTVKEIEEGKEPSLDATDFWFQYVSTMGAWRLYEKEEAF